MERENSKPRRIFHFRHRGSDHGGGCGRGTVAEKARPFRCRILHRGPRWENLLTNVPGSSGYFLGGVIAYSNQAKMDLLGVSGQDPRDLWSGEAARLPGRWLKG